jgi:hypothetical protein
MIAKIAVFSPHGDRASASCAVVMVVSASYILFGGAVWAAGER